jgi:DivIVA domain-containing protein
MDITPQVINEVAFHKARRGYDPAEVDDFLDAVAAAFGNLQHRVRDLEVRAEASDVRAAEAEYRYQELASAPPQPQPLPAEPQAATFRPVPDHEPGEAHDAMTGLEAEPESIQALTSAEYDEQMASIQRTLVIAQQTADQVVREARAEAARLMVVAEAEAEQLLVDTRNQSQRMLEQAEAEASVHGRATKARLEQEVEALDSVRTGYLSDTGLLARHVADQRQQIAAAVAELHRTLEDKLHLVEPPTLSGPAAEAVGAGVELSGDGDGLAESPAVEAAAPVLDEDEALPAPEDLDEVGAPAAAEADEAAAAATGEADEDEVDTGDVAAADGADEIDVRDEVENGEPTSAWPVLGAMAAPADEAGFSVAARGGRAGKAEGPAATELEDEAGYLAAPARGEAGTLEPMGGPETSIADWSGPVPASLQWPTDAPAEPLGVPMSAAGLAFDLPGSDAAGEGPASWAAPGSASDPAEAEAEVDASESTDNRPPPPRLPAGGLRIPGVGPVPATAPPGVRPPSPPAGEAAGGAKRTDRAREEDAWSRFVADEEGVAQPASEEAEPVEMGDRPPQPPVIDLAAADRLLAPEEPNRRSRFRRR